MRQRICTQIQTNQDRWNTHCRSKRSWHGSAPPKPVPVVSPPRGVSTGHSHLSIWFVGFHQFHSLASPHEHDLGVPKPSHMQHIPSDESHHPGGSTAQALEKIDFHFKAFSYLTQGQNMLKLQHRAYSQGGTGSAFPTAMTAH